MPLEPHSISRTRRPVGPDIVSRQPSSRKRWNASLIARAADSSVGIAAARAAFAASLAASNSVSSIFVAISLNDRVERGGKFRATRDRRGEGKPLVGGISGRMVAAGGFWELGCAVSGNPCKLLNFGRSSSSSNGPRVYADEIRGFGTNFGSILGSRARKGEIRPSFPSS